MTSQLELPLPLSPSKFVLGGNATFTLLSKKTGKRFTFRARAAKDDKSRTYVKVLTGPDNTANFTFLGTIFGLDAHAKYHHGKRSPISPTAKSAEAFDWFFKHVGNLPIDKVEFIPSGKCCRCNRVLTTPASVALGYGPECAKRLRSS